MKHVNFVLVKSFAVEVKLSTAVMSSSRSGEPLHDIPPDLGFPAVLGDLLIHR